VTTETIRGLLDLNDNGVLGLPDLLGWALFGTVGTLGAATVLGTVLLALVGVGRATLAAGRGAARTAHRVRD
jgi:hypothetical protein